MRPTAQILVGDVRERLAELPEESVHCCMTSPPYWSLRDYGTGRWEGGSAECDHVRSKLTLRSGLAEAANACDGGKRTDAGRKDQEVTICYRDTCARCGAIRIDQQIGLESALDCLSWATGAEPCRACWICSMRDTFAAVRRVLRPDGVCWVNVGDAYNAAGRHGHGTRQGAKQGTNRASANGCDMNRPTVDALKPKDMCLAPSRLALALQADGWYVRSIAPWVKRSSMPQSVRDRPSTSLEWMIMLTREARYFWDQEAVQRYGGPGDHARHVLDYPDRSGGVMPPHTGIRQKESRNGHGRNLRDSDWWFDSVGMLLRDEVLGFDVVSEPSSDQHYASYPRRLVRDVVLAGSSGAGVCGECGAPWVRVVEKGLSMWDMRKSEGERMRAGDMSEGTPNKKNCGEPLATWKALHPDKHAGFRPSCSHAAPRIPATILDPFCGRGTTGVVALEYGRSFIGIELSEEYAAMARRRLAAVECQPLLDVSAPEQAPRAEQMAMEVD